MVGDKVAGRRWRRRYPGRWCRMVAAFRMYTGQEKARIELMSLRETEDIIVQMQMSSWTRQRTMHTKSAAGQVPTAQLSRCLSHDCIKLYFSTLPRGILVVIIIIAVASC